MNVAAVVLAAGASRRLGRPKQEIIIAGETLLDRSVRLALDACLSPVVVVTRPHSKYGNLNSDRSIIIAPNHDAEEGIASSIRCGVALASNYRVAGVVLLTCDQPSLRSDHLRALVEDKRLVTGSAYAGSVGVPAYFPATSFPLLMQLRGDEGARKLLVNARAVSAEDLALDIDTEQDLAAARSLFESIHTPG